jgi:hypothetical protein
MSVKNDYIYSERDRQIKCKCNLPNKTKQVTDIPEQLMFRQNSALAVVHTDLR